MADVEKVRPHKFANALGSASIYGFIVGVPATIINNMRGISSIGNDEKLFKFAKSPVTWALALIPLTASIVGAVKGWKRAGREDNYIAGLEQQNAELAKANEIVTIEAAMQAQGLQNQIAGLQTEVASGKKSFVEMHTKHTAEKEELEKQFAEKAKHHASQLEAAHAAHAHHASHAAQHEAPQAEAAQPSQTEAQAVHAAEHTAEHGAEHAAQTSHADAHTSRAEHGGHAAAHEAEKQAAQHAEVAR